MQNLHIIFSFAFHQLNSRDSLCGCDCILCAVTNGTEDDDKIIHRFSPFLFGRVQRTDLLTIHDTLRGTVCTYNIQILSISTLAYYHTIILAKLMYVRYDAY